MKFVTKCDKCDSCPHHTGNVTKVKLFIRTLWSMWTISCENRIEREGIIFGIFAQIFIEIREPTWFLISKYITNLYK